MRGKNVLFLIGLCVSFLINTSQAAPQNLSIQQRATKLSIIEQVGSFLLMRSPCGTPLFTSCGELVTNVSPGVDRQVEAHIEAAYAGHYLNPFAKNDSEKYAEGMFMQTPICNFFEGEKDDEKCGTHCKITCTKGENINCSVNPATCQKERAWMRGALIHLVRKNKKAVVEEFQQNNRVQLSDRCQAVVQDSKFQALQKDLSLQLEEWVQISQGRPIECQVEEQDDGSFAAQPDPTLPKELACYLNAARTGFETLIAPLLVCEIFARAELDWINGERDSFESYPNLSAKMAVASEACKDKRAGSVNGFQKCVQAEYEQSVVKNYSLDQLSKIMFPAIEKTVMPGVGR